MVLIIGLSLSLIISQIISLMISLIMAKHGRRAISLYLSMFSFYLCKNGDRERSYNFYFLICNLLYNL